MKYRVQPTLVERVMRDEDFIVSKTDLKGGITYANRIFIEYSGYSEEDLLGKPQNIVRHPDMPRGIFKYLWGELENNRPVLAYVKNMAADGAFYWVFANMTPSYDPAGAKLGYFSVRRAPARRAIEAMEVIYRSMREAEARVPTARQPETSLALLKEILDQHGKSYVEFISSL